MISLVLSLDFGCEINSNRGSHFEKNENGIDDMNLAGQSPKGKAIRIRPRFIPGDLGAKPYYEEAQRYRAKNASSVDVDRLLERMEGRRFILLEKINAYWGTYKFLVIYEDTPGVALAFSREPYHDFGAVSAKVPPADFEENLHLLEITEDSCTKEDTGIYAAADPSAFRFIWTERDRIREYWIMGSYFVRPRQLSRPLTEDCIGFMERLMDVYKNCKKYL